MPSSLLPERPLIVSPTLAATVGLEEAVLLHVFAELMHTRSASRADNRDWIELGEEDFQLACPFWAPVDLHRVLESLEALGMLLIRNGSRPETKCYALDEDPDSPARAQAKAEGQGPQAPMTASSAAPARGWNSGERGAASALFTLSDSGSSSTKATPIAPDWYPTETWIAQCSQQGIPDDFIHALVPEFVGYWLDRGQSRWSWGNAFYKHALKEWRRKQSRQGPYEIITEMGPEWAPSPDAIEIMANSGVSLDFMEDAIPEFVLYWREKGDSEGAWNSRFVEHVRRQWAKFSTSFGLDNTPRPIASDWQPSQDCIEILQLAEIDLDFARSKVPEFVLYWKDRNEAKSSWNTTFLQFVKHDWSRRLKQQQVTELENAENRQTAGTGSARVQARFERFADRSWAG